jgi:dTDP-4-amino-4,6-dideoxygalactose transaminase
MTELQAAVGIPQLEMLADFTEVRQRNAARLTEGLCDIPGLILPEAPAERQHVFNQYTVRVPDEAPVNRDQLAAALADAGIASGVYYPKLVFDYDCYRAHAGVQVSPVPHAARVVDEVLSLPVYPGLADADLDRIVDHVRGAFGR